jgi:hypothetical protein
MQTDIIQKFNLLVEKIESRKPYYVEIGDWLDEMIGLMLQDSLQTLDFLNNCDQTHERIIFWLSPLFDEITFKYPDDEIADAMQSLVEKYPQCTMLQQNVDMAIKILRNVQADPDS